MVRAPSLRKNPFGIALVFKAHPRLCHIIKKKWNLSNEILDKELEEKHGLFRAFS